MEVTREMATAMAKWWGEQVHTDTRHDNGDDSITGLFASILANRLNKEVTPEANTRFVEILTERILERAKEKGRVWSLELSCDYGPSEFLYDAAKEAGIDSGNFPWKTDMRVREEDDGTAKVLVSAGYRAPWVQIWPEVK